MSTQEEPSRQDDPRDTDPFVQWWHGARGPAGKGLSRIRCARLGWEAGRATPTTEQAADIHSCSYYCDRPGCIKAQRDELRERAAQTSGAERKLIAFAAWVIEYLRGDDSGSDLNGGDAQDEMERLGLIEKFNVTEPCNAEHCKCAEYGDFPQFCLRLTSAARATLAQAPAAPEPKT